jgi:tetratricopeptide (TPR) repeat protein
MNDAMLLRFRMAEMSFGEHRYLEAAVALEEIVAEFPEHSDAQTLLARSYYHSARLGKAEEQARAILERCPVDAYARLILARSLQRQSRHEEAEPHLRLAAAMTGEDV